MGRSEQRRQYQSIIHYQIDTGEPKTTKNYYEKFMDAGMHEESAIQLLAYVLETYTKAIIGSNQPFSEFEWKSYLDQVQIEPFDNEAIAFEKEDERYLLKQIKKDFGTLTNAQNYIRELVSIEKSLLVAYLLFDINETDAKRILFIVMQSLLDKIENTKHHYENYTQEDLLRLAKNILFCVDPYENEELYHLLENTVDLENEKARVFKPIFQCLLKINDKIDSCIKKRRSYFMDIQEYIKVDYTKKPEYFFNESTLKKL